MKSRKKTIGVVTLVAVMVILQLVVAPAAMARPLEGTETHVSLIRSFERGMGVDPEYCGEFCFTGFCSDDDCYCSWPLCMAR
ncbi:unnamed protein product [Alopecurus aequalis]